MTRRILGIDFSGASDAGRKIWIAEGRLTKSGAMALLDLRQACALEGGGLAPGVAIAALAKHIVRVPDTVAGCDFPFTLPSSLIDRPTWAEFVRSFPKRFGDPDTFRAWALRKAGGRELRRAADRAAATPFNSYNLRIYRHTWWGIVALLHPLVTSGAAIVFPHQRRPKVSHPILIEACPACALKWIGLYPSYKGATEQHGRNRRALLQRLIDIKSLVPPDRDIAEEMVHDKGGDALDAVIAALIAAAWTGKRDDAPKDPIEGAIYWKLARLS